MAVHDVHMEQVDVVLDPIDFVAKVGEVGGKNGRCDARWFDHGSRVYPVPERQNPARRIHQRADPSPVDQGYEHPVGAGEVRREEQTAVKLQSGESGGRPRPRAPYNIGRLIRCDRAD